MKKQNAITLIALIITIIILLILAGVVINLAIDENGIMNMAKQAGEDYKIASVKERVEEEIMALEADKIVKGEKLTVEQALIGIEEKEVFEEIDLAEEIGISEGYEIKLGYNEFGNVIILGIEKETGIKIVTNVTPKGYTNQDVVVTISVKPDTIKISNIEVPEGMIKQADETYKITKNGTYLVKVTLEDETLVEKEIKINTIDKQPPKDFTITAQNTEEGFIITGTTQDEEANEENACSGIDYYEYVVTDEEGKETKYTESEIKGLENGTYQIYMTAYDKAGNSTKTKEIEVEVKLKIKFSKISAGGNHSLGIDIEGNLWAWGKNNYGQLGDGTRQTKLEPVLIGENTKFKEISAGKNYSLAIDEEGNLWSWGENGSGQLGDGTMGVQHYKSEPVLVGENTKFKEISAGKNHSLAIDIEGNIYSWGHSYAGALGNGCNNNTETKPGLREVGVKFCKIAAGSYTSLAIDTEGDLWGCGYNGYTTGELGNSSLSPNQLTFERIKPEVKFKDVTSELGRGSSLAIDEENNLWGWGRNAYGEFGNGTSNNYIINMVKIRPDLKVKEVSMKGDFSLVLDVNETLWFCGLDPVLIKSVENPTQVILPKEVKIKQITTGEKYSLAIDEEGNLWAWGNNANGQLGDGTTTNKLIPTKIF